MPYMYSSSQPIIIKDCYFPFSAVNVCAIFCKLIFWRCIIFLAICIDFSEAAFCNNVFPLHRRTVDLKMRIKFFLIYWSSEGNETHLGADAHKTRVLKNFVSLVSNHRYLTLIKRGGNYNMNNSCWNLKR